MIPKIVSYLSIKRQIFSASENKQTGEISKGRKRDIENEF